MLRAPRTRRSGGGPLPSGGVPWILLTNDDGVDSPALRPFRDALAGLGEVRIVAPAEERSWVGKALTRHGPVWAEEVERGGAAAVAVSGYPADAVQVGAAYFGGPPPGLVVSGINLGYNHGAGYIACSGTVGAAFEGWELGIPAAAFSTGCSGRDWHEWHRYVKTEAARPAWRRLANLCAQLLEEIRAADLPGDIVSVNVPWEADSSTPRRVVPPARAAYGAIHRRRPDGAYAHTYRELFDPDLPDDTDIGANRKGEISITPLLAPSSPPVPPEVRAALERTRRPP